MGGYQKARVREGRGRMGRGGGGAGWGAVRKIRQKLAHPFKPSLPPSPTSVHPFKPSPSLPHLSAARQTVKLGGGGVDLTVWAWSINCVTWLTNSTDSRPTASRLHRRADPAASVVGRRGLVNVTWSSTITGCHSSLPRRPLPKTTFFSR